ncbi:MAG TPA: hypothetical protein VNU25_02170 [Candidatus Paceibacterota bacterium]|nr:hypothetical protein [Candidatus Paceibacterota bacterium]
MATKKQVTAAKKNVKKAQAAWKGMTPRQRALAQPQGRDRQKPGTGSAARYYRVELRPARDFTSFRTQDVGKKGGLQRVAGHRASGSWATQAWLISKDHAHIAKNGELIVDDATERAALKKAVRGKIMHVKGSICEAHPAKNVPEKAKPTPAMRKAQAARRKV